MGPILTVRDVAAKLRVSTATVYDLCESGQLAHFRMNNSIRVRAQVLRDFLRGRERRRSPREPRRSARK